MQGYLFPSYSGDTSIALEAFDTLLDVYCGIKQIKVNKAEGENPSPSLTGINQENTEVVMQIGALWTIFYASFIDLLCFLQPFLKREGDFLLVAESVPVPFATYLHFVTTPSLHRELREPSSPSTRPKFHPTAWM